MRRALFATASLVVLCACGSAAPEKTKDERFPVPEDLNNTRFVLDCPAAKAAVKRADGAIEFIEAEYGTKRGSGGPGREYVIKEILPFHYGEWAGHVAANPSCFDTTRLERAHELIDDARRRMKNARKDHPD